MIYTKCNTTRKGLTLLCVLIFSSFLLAVPADVSGYDSQESTMSVSPLPFWDKSTQSATIAYNSAGYITIVGTDKVNTWAYIWVPISRYKDFAFTYSFTASGIPINSDNQNFRLYLGLARDKTLDPDDFIMNFFDGRTQYTRYGVTAYKGIQNNDISKVLTYGINEYINEGIINVKCSMSRSSIMYSLNDFSLSGKPLFENQTMNPSKDYIWLVVVVECFVGTFKILGLNGDTNYAPIEAQSLVVDVDGITSLQRDYVNSLTLSSVTQATTYTLYVPAFQFVRTNMVQDTTLRRYGSYDYTSLTALRVDFYKPDGSVFFYILFAFYTYTVASESLWVCWGNARMRYTANDTIIFGSDLYIMVSYTSSADSVFKAFSKIGVWRTQEGHIGMEFGADTALLQTKPDSTNLTTYISQIKLTNFQAKISWIKSDTSTYITKCVSEQRFDNNEYAYGNLGGVVQPHFSTNWWDGIPIVGWIINGFLYVGGIIINGISSGIGAIFSWLGSALSGIFAVLGGMAGAIWGAFSSILGNIWGGLNAIVAGIETWVYNAIMYGLIPAIQAGLSNLLNGLVILVGGLVDLIGNLFGIADLHITFFSMGASFGSSIGSTIGFIVAIITNGVIIMGTAVSFIIAWAPLAMSLIAVVFALNVFGAFALDMHEGGFDHTVDVIGTWGGLLYRIFNIMWSIVSTVIGFIGGIIP